MKKIICTFKKILINHKPLFVLGTFIFIFFILGFISVPKIFAQPQAIKSIEIFSTKEDYTKKESGSWKINESAKWLERGIGEITFDVDTVMKTNNGYTDLIFVLDVSGSMNGERIEKVKSDTIELIDNLLSNEGNRAALITFESSSKIHSNLTSDKAELIDVINNLTTGNMTNYYQALVNVEKVLKDYENASDRECIVLFLTDGYPNEDTPNEIGQYNYLKSQYPYIKVNGIQYEMGNSVLEPIKRISDKQFVANVKTLDNILFEAAVYPVVYNNFEIIDYVDTEYFDVVSESDIKVNQGKIVFDKNEQKITWKLDSFNSGSKANMIIKAKLKDDLIGKGGFYSTNKKVEIRSQLGKTLDDVPSIKTPILADNYRVIYDINAPNDCVVEGVPEEKQHSVFDTVAISDSAPKCEGYQFKGWKVTSDVKKINDDYFIMPEDDVTVTANWGSLGIRKSMEGTVNEKLTLYKQVKLDYETNNNAKKYEDSRETFLGNQDVYYYYGNTPNNNVLFGNFCWKIYRTTDTGGVKMIYNGEPDSDGRCGADRGTHVGYGLERVINLYSEYMYGTDYIYDKSSGQFTLSGNIETTRWSSSTFSDLIGKYTCVNSTGNCSTLYRIASFSSYTNANALPINSTTAYSQIGISPFNLPYTSPAYSGYMYNKVYSSINRSMTSYNIVLYESSISNNSYYADDIEWGVQGPNYYSLVNPYRVSSVSEYQNLVGKYTFRSNAESYLSNQIYYIVGVEGAKMYYIPLANGNDLDTVNTQYFFADSIIEADDGSGRYVLEPTTTKIVKRTEWYDNYENLKGKFYCSDESCENVYYITSTTPTNFNYVDIADNFIYGNSFTYDNEKGEYTLSGETHQFYDWPGNYNKTANAHYTCWNTSGTCNSISYVLSINSNQAYHIKLENGVSIEKALDEMLYDSNVNVMDSRIKHLIDYWYADKMLKYTEYLEDAVWCNDRSISNLGGWNPNGGSIEKELFFKSRDNANSLICPNKNDRFTVNEENGNGALTYPVGLVTRQEQSLAYQSGSNSPFASSTSNMLLSPYHVRDGAVTHYYLTEQGNSSYYDSIRYNQGVRPAISLRPGISYIEGNGTVDAPYIIDLES